jgi:hypothetical protein
MSEMNNSPKKVLCYMKETETKRKEPYETPAVLDIKPVTVCCGGLSDGGYDDDEG